MVCSVINIDFHVTSSHSVFRGKTKKCSKDVKQSLDWIHTQRFDVFCGPYIADFHRCC